MRIFKFDQLFPTGEHRGRRILATAIAVDAVAAGTAVGFATRAKRGRESTSIPDATPETFGNGATPATPAESTGATPADAAPESQPSADAVPAEPDQLQQYPDAPPAAQ